VSVLRSRDNPRVKRWTKLVQDGRLRKKEGRCLVEGPHLVAALLESGLKPLAVLASEPGLKGEQIKSLVEKSGVHPVVLSEGVFRSIADAESPPGIAAEIAIPQAEEKSSLQAVFLEGVQDPANVGAIIRSAAAFGVGAVVLDRGCADPWSPKVLRAAMGGHFQLCIRSIAAFEEELKRFEGKLLCTVPKDGRLLADADLTGRLGWLFGAEGKGVSAAAALHAALRVTIPMVPTVESLNVAATAAICLYAAFSVRNPPPAAL
jgi:RNA methyltransferase, TrmH family